MLVPTGQTPLLGVERLRVALSIHKGILKCVMDHNVVVNDVSFSLRSNETLGLVEESGSRKNTTRLTLLQLTTSQENVVFGGLALHILNRRQLLPIRRHIQVVFQGPNSSLSPRLSVLQTIKEGLRVHQSTLSAEQCETQVRTVTEEVGLDSET